MMPKVSVLIPTYNRPSYFELALKSAIAQTYRPIEIIVCDNSDNEETEEIVEIYRKSHGSLILYERNDENLGPIGNQHKCYSLATGEYINYLMDDDLFHPQKIEKMMHYFHQYKDVTLVTSHRQTIDENGFAIPSAIPFHHLVKQDSLFDGIGLGNLMLQSGLNFIGEPTTVLFRKADLDEPFGMFVGIQAQNNVDVAAWLNLLSKGKAIYISKTLSYCRIHLQQLSFQESSRLKGLQDWMDHRTHGYEKGFLRFGGTELSRMIRAWKESPNKTGISYTLPLIIDGECCGIIRPITEDILTKEIEIEMLTNWRLKAKNWFTTQFDVTAKSTKEWLQSRILPDASRILFIVETKDHQLVGHIGLCNINEQEKTCELDNILRGNRQSFSGWMYHACRTLLNWSFQVLNMETIFLNVLADNQRAIGMYHKLGFQEIKIAPLKKVEEGNLIRWVPTSNETDLDANRYLMKMRMRREKTMQINDAKEERYWQNWDQGDVAKRIDEFWVSSEDSWRTTIVSDIKNCLGENSKITEIGCGTGLICQRLLQLGVVDKDSYHGGDVSSNMLKIAKERLPEIDFNSWDILNLNLEDKSQPNVICIQVLQHLPDYQDALKELVRVTKESLYISTWYNTTTDSHVTFADLSQDWEGQKFYNNNYSLPNFLKDLIAFSNNNGRVIQDIKVRNFHFYHNYSVFVSFHK